MPLHHVTRGSSLPAHRTSCIRRSSIADRARSLAPGMRPDRVKYSFVHLRLRCAEWRRRRCVRLGAFHWCTEHTHMQIAAHARVKGTFGLLRSIGSVPVSTWVPACMPARVRAGLSANSSTRMRTHVTACIPDCMPARLIACMPARMRARMSPRMLACMRTRAHTLARVHAYKHALASERMRACMRARMRVCTHVRTHAQHSLLPLSMPTVDAIGASVAEDGAAVCAAEGLADDTHITGNNITDTAATSVYLPVHSNPVPLGPCVCTCEHLRHCNLTRAQAGAAGCLFL